MNRMTVLAPLALVVACSIEQGDERVAADLPDRAVYAQPNGPGQLLVLRCGSLDCHGSSYRNYRLYGYGSARLEPGRRPDYADTTTAELEAGYDATVAIEPDRTRAIAVGAEPVVAATLVRKARGGDNHLGGFRLVEGEAADRCLVGWLTRRPDDAACTTALAALPAPLVR